MATIRPLYIALVSSINPFLTYGVMIPELNENLNSNDDL